MKLYINNPPSQTINIIAQINNIVNRLNELYSNAEQYNICTEENHKLRSETLPMYEEQEIKSANALSALESKKTKLTNAIKHIQPLQLVEKKKLQNELAEIENQIGIYYNNYTRAKSSVGAIIQKITDNNDFIDTHPLLSTIHTHKQIIAKELNPAIKQLSKLINIPLVTYEPTSMFYIEKYEIANEDKFELEQ